MSIPIDLGPAVRQLSEILKTVPEDRLAAPTPCEDYDVSALIGHIGAFAVAFTAAGRKENLEGPPPADLDPGWRTSIPANLEVLRATWADPGSWEGTANIAGTDMPAATVGVIALCELVVHAWDLGVSVGVDAHYDGPGLAEALEWTRQLGGDPIPGLFGPAVPADDDAGDFEALLAATGRDRRWGSP